VAPLGSTSAEAGKFLAVRALAHGAARLLGAALVSALILLASACGGPHGPEAGIGITAGVPGALPRDFDWSYRDTYRGWPVWPRHRQHPIRGSFLDPRGRSEQLGGYHFGIDISVDDAHPDPSAPRGLGHRVYAVEGGEASDVLAAPLHPACSSRRLSIAHFDYWHVSPTVTPGQHVAAGAPIGWSCLGEWHVHLAEWTRVDGQRIWVNPLHPGGKIAPYTDTAPPLVQALRFFGAPGRALSADLEPPAASVPLAADRLHGLVELRAEIGDPQSHWGFIARHPRWETLFHPYRVEVTIRSRSTREIVLRRVEFQSDQLPDTPFLVHYAPSTVQNETIPQCRAGPPRADCAGTYWFRPFSRSREELWNTAKVRNGAYEITVRSWDIAGNSGAATRRVVVANSPAQ